MAKVKRSIYRPDNRAIARTEISYDCLMRPLVVSLLKVDIPNNCMDLAAPQFMRDIFDFVLFIRQMFDSHHFRSDLYIIEKAALVPVNVHSGEMTLGYMVLVMVEEIAFVSHFALFAKSAIAINRGHMKMNEALSLPLEKLQEKLEDFDVAAGVANGARRNDQMIGTMLNIAQLDHDLTIYHSSATQRYPGLSEEAYGRDVEDAWRDRAMKLSPEFLFMISPRTKGDYVQLLRLDQVIRKHAGGSGAHIKDKTATLNNVEIRMGDHPEEETVLSALYKQHTRLFQWRETLRPAEDGGMVLDLSNRVAWKVDRAHCGDITFFREHEFYTVPSQEEVEKMRCPYGDYNDADDVSEDSKLAKLSIALSFSAMQDAADNEEPALYPTMDHLKKEFIAFARELGGGEICAVYNDELIGPFMLGVFNDFMKGNKIQMSRARREQYTNVTYLMEKLFHYGCLNAARDRNTGRSQLQCGQMFSDVDPFQGIFASQVIRMAQMTGVCHLSNEFYVLLLSNIISFTPKRYKPLVILDGPTGQCSDADAPFTG